VILATELSLGYPWYFLRERIGSPGVGFIQNPSLTLANAVSASTAVPGVFEPVYLQIDKADLQFRDPGIEAREEMARLFWQLSQEEKAMRTERGEDTFPFEPVWAEIEALRLQARKEIIVPVQLVDGGVLDNLASESCQSAERSIVSDASLYNVIDASDHGISRLAIAERAIDVMQRINTSNLTQNLVRNNLVRSRMSLCSLSDDEDCVDPFFSYISLARETPAAIQGLDGDKDQLKRFAQLPTRLAELELDQQSSLVNWGYVAADSVLSENRPLQELIADGRARPFRLPFDVPSDAEEQGGGSGGN
jgi:predicted acylesterase/phospholipase RssA